MELVDFVRKVCNAIEMELGQGYAVEPQEVRKNNGVCKQGLSIRAEKKTVAPIIYLESYWEAHKAGIPFDAIINRVLSVYEENRPANDIDDRFFMDYEKVKNRICYRLVGRESNEALLEKVSYIEFLDLAICFYYPYYDKSLGRGTISITNAHMKMWQTNTSELFQLAQYNTLKLFPWKCIAMGEILKDLLEQNAGGAPYMPETSGKCEIPMRILTNAQMQYGAACILYPNVLRELAMGDGRNIYIIPSSVHDTILLPDMGAESAEMLKSMIAEVNRTEVAPEDVLSNSLYYYDFREKRMTIV